jgi:hypothetical protein
MATSQVTPMTPSDTGDGFQDRGQITFSVNYPAHSPRVDSPLFIKTKKLLNTASGGKCFICGRTAKETKVPHEAHHHPIMYSMMDVVDWTIFAVEAQRGDYGSGPQKFPWANFDPKNPVSFVDDMRYNGILLCKNHHTGPNMGVHVLPWPLFIAQKYAKAGYKFSDSEIIIHSTST